jgi:hypothetical protein
MARLRVQQRTVAEYARQSTASARTTAAAAATATATAAEDGSGCGCPFTLVFGDGSFARGAVVADRVAAGPLAAALHLGLVTDAAAGFESGTAQGCGGGRG